jgi:hypothetical protein
VLAKLDRLAEDVGRLAQDGQQPAAAAPPPPHITRDEYARWSQRERILRNREVNEVLRRNGGRLPD